MESFCLVCVCDRDGLYYLLISNMMNGKPERTASGRPRASGGRGAIAADGLSLYRPRGIINLQRSPLDETGSSLSLSFDPKPSHHPRTFSVSRSKVARPPSECAVTELTSPPSLPLAAVLPSLRHSSTNCSPRPFLTPRSTCRPRLITTTLPTPSL